jgi:Tfp pilus assembly protein PilN
MTTEPGDREPTLSDVIEKLDKLTQDQERFAQDQDRFNERFSNYQQATQWLVQLAFTLIASATLTLIITVVLRR